eukprot:TRINITY_DN28665_c0_g1_i1.p1 TRINITY_DN28665_c0_g1~~TRINITY_DN28665_c0_g1_i1.p1  ORF type:complete len:113 (-),score=14.27 TRINITY_DN28665_c0_g1_i1:50-388(-)
MGSHGVSISLNVGIWILTESTEYNDLKDALYSPFYAEWKGLCPLYFMVGGTEMLLQDTINAATKAYQAGVEVKVDIEPNMVHTWCLFQRAYVEAHYCVVRAADFILLHLSSK